MKQSEKSFTEFEFDGWGDRNVCENYDEHLGRVTIQSVKAMLDAANVRERCDVLDVCTGAKEHPWPWSHYRTVTLYMPYPE